MTMRTSYFVAALVKAHVELTSFGLALACTTLLVYSPFAQRSLVLMGAGGGVGISGEG